MTRGQGPGTRDQGGVKSCRFVSAARGEAGQEEDRRRRGGSVLYCNLCTVLEHTVL